MFRLFAGVLPWSYALGILYRESRLPNSWEALGLIYPKLSFSVIFYLSPLKEIVVERDLAQRHMFGFFF